MLSEKHHILYSYIINFTNIIAIITITYTRRTSWINGGKKVDVLFNLADNYINHPILQYRTIFQPQPRLMFRLESEYHSPRRMLASSSREQPSPTVVPILRKNFVENWIYENIE